MCLQIELLHASSALAWLLLGCHGDNSCAGVSCTCWANATRAAGDVSSSAPSCSPCPDDQVGHLFLEAEMIGC